MSTAAWRRICWTAAVLAVIVFAWTVWPTPHRHFMVYRTFPARENRFTGAVDIFNIDEGWRRQASEQPAPPGRVYSNEEALEALRRDAADPK